MPKMPKTKEAVVNPLKEALKYGQSLWYDGLISTNEFERMIREDGMRGATTNPTIFEKAILSGNTDEEIKRLAGTRDEEEIYKILVVKAVQEVADVFLPVFKETKGLDGFVSLEVSPLLAHDTASTIQEARELFGLAARENVMIKVPATSEGIPAIEALIAEGINVNVTLIFSVARYRQVMNAYISGLERRNREAKPVGGIASVASFFVSRVDTAADLLIEAKIHSEMNLAKKETLKNLLGKTAIANSKIAYDEFERMFSSERFQKLKSQGARPQRPLWASTGTKNPKYSDVLYVEALIGPDTVNTMPPATLDAFRDHGVAAPRLKEDFQAARQTLETLGLSGISLDEITQKLEKTGVQLFGDSYNKIIDEIRGVKRK